MAQRRSLAALHKVGPTIPAIVDNDESVGCSLARHYWRADFDWGDTCECGEYYLTRLENGTIEMIERNDPS